MRKKIFAYLPTIIVCFACLCMATFSARAQLQANFTADKTGGCSPLTIKFTNTTTGGSASTTYTWDLGNGNSSAQPSPGATYFTEKTYTITLTAKDGATTNIKTTTITVYKKPTVDFSLNPGKGCVPLPVNFTANASPGDGTISNYLWDFGDGTTDQGAALQTTNHTYTVPQKPPVSLTVTNSHGCYATTTKSNLVEAVKNVQAAFTPSLLNICKAGDPVSFTNSSTGSGTLTYAWDFGDGKTSADREPKHTYNQPGSFTVKLKVISSDGCSKDATPVTLNVANFKADFDVPPLICAGQHQDYENKSTTGFDEVQWSVDGGPYENNNYFNNILRYTIYEAGEHTITIKLKYGQCEVTTTKKIIVNPTPTLNGFIDEIQGACGIPVTFKFTDTTKLAVKWEWMGPDYQVFSTNQTASYTFTQGSYAYIWLKVTNKEGCLASKEKGMYFQAPQIKIQAKNTKTGIYWTDDCAGNEYQFFANPDTLIKDFKWNFGDGATSVDKNPIHKFDKGGVFTTTLDYTTKNGCKGVQTYQVHIIEKPIFDFSVVGSTTICGNTPTTFNLSVIPATNAGWQYTWYANDTYIAGYFGINNHKFRYDTTYTIKLIASFGQCADTIVKQNYLTVLPPFPEIEYHINTCDDTRGLVKFVDDTYKTQNWKWDFGDGSPPLTYTAKKDTVSHLYAKTGYYKVMLSTTYGPCTVKDSTDVYVVLKQKPILKALQPEVCGATVTNFEISNFETNPTATTSWNYHFRHIGWDAIALPQNVSINYLFNQDIDKKANIAMYDLPPGISQIRLITFSYGLGCQDTSNFVPLKIKGPQVGYKTEPHSGCFKDPLIFTDTSKNYFTNGIVKWEWDLGDGTIKTLTNNKPFAHKYKEPGTYYIKLKVTDNEGCSSETAQYAHYVFITGPKADFTASSYNVSPQTRVSFQNTSMFFHWQSDAGHNLKWIMPDGSSLTDDNTTYLFGDEGKYNVTLVTYNRETGCTDSITKVITVRKANSAFTYTFSYINNNACPPVIARFTSISTNAQRVSWNFGDGGVADDQKTVSHTYHTPGMYRVVHYAYDNNNAVDSTEDFIEVKGPYALLKADTLYACNTLQVKLSADVRYAKGFTWDFGDGTLIAGTDTFATHQYLTPGVYQPALILTDNGGCTATSVLTEKIVVDSLAASFSSLPTAICDQATVTFTPAVQSFALSRLQSPLNYQWNFKQGNNPAETLSSETAGYFFTQPGQHPVTLTVTSAYGCRVTVNKTVDVKPGIKAAIAATAQVCVNDPITFNGIATPAAEALTWQWLFGPNNTANVQNPASQTFVNPGQQNIRLIVSNGACTDTAIHLLNINALPATGITSMANVLCQGDSLELTANGGSRYEWTPALFIANTSQATATIWPANNQTYKVKVTNAQNCSTTDSITITVIAPLKVNVTSPLFACAGKTVQLNANGANRYTWINGTGLSNTQIANPIATTTNSTTYTVVGTDQYNCFADTAIVQVRIGELPTVNAGPNLQMNAGEQVKLIANSSPNVTQWQWTPADWLSCANCANPTSTPKASTSYIVKVTTADGCTATDTVRIELACKSELVFIPTGFTPNGDNLNDRFAIHGSGIKNLRHIAIFDRWGKVIFERHNADPLDRNNTWDGTMNGQPLPSAAYVYMVEVECTGGDVFMYKGSVMLVR